MKRKIFSLVLLSALISARADADSGQIGVAQVKPSSVEILFVPNGYSYITHINAENLKKIGCQYMLSDAVAASDLLALASNARQKATNPDQPILHFETRNLLIFHIQHEKDIVISYSKEFSNLSHLMGSWDGEPVQLRIGLLGQVRDVIDRANLRQLNDKAPQSCGSK